MSDKKEARRQAELAFGQKDFYQFCCLMDASFYKPDREYLHCFCDVLQEFWEGEKSVLVVNMPPRHGKSYTITHFVEWMLGRNKDSKIITASYNGVLSIRFSKKVRDDITEIKVDDDRITYSDIFPGTQIKKNDRAMNLWSLVGSYNNYLSTSPTGTATGFGASLIIVDDIIKNAQEALNARIKDENWDWFTNTMLSRLEEGGKVVVVMTRWATDDLAGRILREYPDAMLVNYKAVQDNGEMLCPEILSKESIEEKKRMMGEHIWRANYQQEPIDIKGRLYDDFKTYDDIPRDSAGNPRWDGIYSYTDTADQGEDYLAHIVYGVRNKEAYILDIIYTQEPMEITEKKVAESLVRNDVRVAEIESNNGGRGFARAVERILRDEWKTNKCRVSWFNQGKNKMARILTNAPWVMEHIYFPENWRNRYPDAYSSLMGFQREGRNAHDDIEDALTGVCERITESMRGLKINPTILRRR